MDTRQGRKQVVGLDPQTPLIRLELDSSSPIGGSGVSEEEIFLTAKELRQSEERAACVERVCADRPELRERVQRLLAADEAADELFERRDVAESLVEPAGAPTHSPAPGAGSRVGRYQLLEKIGEGGFGLVFMAEQREPVRRKVAIWPSCMRIPDIPWPEMGRA